MAQALRQDSEFIRTNAAYDFYGAAAPVWQPETEAEQLPQDRPQENPRRRSRPESHFMTVVGCLAAACVMLLVLFAHQRLYEATFEVSGLQKELSALQAEQIQIRSAYDNAVDLAEIERIATTRLGMNRPAAGQTVYLSLPGADRGEVLVAENDGVLAQFGRFVRDAFANLGAYLSQK